MCTVFCQLFKGYVFTSVTLKSSSSLHRQLFAKVSHVRPLRAKDLNSIHRLVFPDIVDDNDNNLQVIRAPMWFFDTTPSGRVLNRFSKDMDEIDVRLSQLGEQFIQNAVTVIIS